MGIKSNISLALFRKFLLSVGCECVGTNGGHEKWRRDGLTRPIIIQTHIDPIPEFIVRNALRTLNVSMSEFLAAVKSL